MAFLNLGCGYNYHPDWINIDFVATGPGVIAHDLKQGIPFADNHFDLVYHSHVLEHFPKALAPQFLQECYRVLRPGGVLRVVVPDLEQIVKLYLQFLSELRHQPQPLPNSLIARQYEWIMLELYDQAVRHYSGGEMVHYLQQLAQFDQTDSEMVNFIISRIGQEGQALLERIRKHQLRGSGHHPESALAVGQFRLGGEPHLWMYDTYALQKLLMETGFIHSQIQLAQSSYWPGFRQYHLDTDAQGHPRKPDSLFMEAIKPRPLAWVYSPQGNGEHTLKIVHLSTSDVGGGAAKAAYRLHRGLLQLGHQSLMVVKQKFSDDATVYPVKICDDFNPSIKAQQAIQKNYINDNRTPLSNTFFSLPYLGLNLSQLPEIQAADVINLHWVAGEFLSINSIHQLLELGKPIVWTFHDMWPFTGGCHYGAGCRGYEHTCHACPQLAENPYDLPALVLQDKLDRFSGGNLTLVTPSQWLKNCAAASLVFRNRTIRVIPYALETHIFVPHPKSEAKQKLGINPDTCVLLFVAHNRHEKRKGFDYLEGALIYCAQDASFQAYLQSQKIQLICLGQGSQEPLFPGLEVMFIDYQEREEDISWIYAAGDVLLLPSLEDNLPNTVLEAMSCGTPVLAFGVGGIPEMVKPGQNGFLVNTIQASDLGQEILRFIKTFFEDYKSLTQLNHNARHWIEQHYPPEQQAQDYLHLYQSLLEHQSITPNPLDKAVVMDALTYDPQPPTFFSQVFLELSVSCLAASLTQAQAKITELEPLKDELVAAQGLAEEMQILREHAEREITAIKTSKFWQLREAWFGIKKRLGLG